MKTLSSIHWNNFLPWGSISRCTLDAALIPRLKQQTPGLVLDAGGASARYKKYIPHLEYRVLDIAPEYHPDYCCDIHDMKIIPHETFDVVIASEVLEHCSDTFQAVNEIYRVLKKDGSCLLSTRFIHPIHDAPYDYYRFTEAVLVYLFKKYSRVEITPLGNRLHCIWKLLSFKPLIYLLYPLNPLIAKIKVSTTRCPLVGYLVYAIK